MKNTAIAGMLVLILLAFVPGTVEAQTSPLYITDGDFDFLKAIQGGVVVDENLATGGNRRYRVVVRDTIWLGDMDGVGSNAEFDLDLDPTGNTSAVGLDILEGTDGATDGSFNYTVESFVGTAGVYRYNLDWSGGASLFSVSGDEIVGITYDTVNGTLWISDRNTIYQYTLGGALISSFGHVGNRGSLAYEPATDTLWYVSNGLNTIRQYSKGGALLQTLAVPYDGNVWGAEFQMFASVCGDGNLDPGEECDDGNTVDGDGCDANCVIEFCGDGIVNNGGTEECDDGNNVSGDGCDANCVIEFCGDGIINNGGTEECDDGNMAPNDGCDANCVIEFCGDGVLQTGIGEECDDGNTIDGDGCQGNCLLPFCGDGILDAGEECDDGNNDDADGCQGNCQLPICGDGIVDAFLGEECDDGNNTDADGCQGNCLLPVCGDGILDTDQGEECDDGNTTDGDGCQGNCLLPFCGDGILDAGEGCDDGNNDDLDGCAANCQLEGACCSDGPNTESECFITTAAGCAADGNSALYLGDGSICETDIDCVALLVQYESWSATATPDGVLIRWVTALEVETIGFRVLRETAGTREKQLSVVVEMYPANGHGLGGASYELLDPSEHSDAAVSYYLEDIDIFGKVTRHGPISIDRGSRQNPTSRSSNEVTRQR